MNKPHCAVTGASGYVGSRLASGISGSFEIVALGRKAEASGIRWSFDQATSIAGDLQQRGVTALVHSAWDFAHPKAADNWKANVEGSRRLLDDAKTAGVQRIVFISTISAYDGARSEYGKSKLAVEKLVLSVGGTVIRPGLVWGDRPGGMFGSLRDQVKKGGIVPVIGDGRFPQYLVHEDDLAEAVRLVLLDPSYAGRLLTLANPRVWLLRDLILRMAAEQGTKVKLVGLPWRLVHAGLKTAETLGVKLGFRSDSLVSLVYQNPAPKFDATQPVALREFV